MKSPHPCQHLNITQAGSETIINTFCTNCNELIKSEKPISYEKWIKSKKGK